MYDLSDVLDVTALEAVPAGASILVSGPAMTGTESLVREMVASGATDGEGAVFVTTGGTAGDVLGDLRKRAPDADPDQFSVIDSRGEGTDDATSGAHRHHVADPSDLTGMGVGITNALERLERGGIEQARLGLSSLSTMLTYTDRQTVFKFCHVLTSRIDAADFLGAFTIDQTAHDEQTLQVVKQPFDGLLEVRERDGDREARVLGVQPDPSPWVDL